ncbi:MAG: TIGR02147 family protein [Oligoflexia bacterium]|nr:TIGR02147 family protein [Oligoflexia bacterium]
MRLVYDYSCYRTFLKEHYLEQKTRHGSFSFAVYAKQLGLSSASHIQLILSGKRNLTVHGIHRVVEALGLPKAEIDYLEALVHENQAESDAEKAYYRERLFLLRKEKPASSARVRVSHLLSSGILPALLLSVDGKELETALGAAERFSYSREEFRKLLDLMLKEGLITLKDGRIRLSQRHLILHDKKARSQAQKNFLAQQLRLSVRAFERMYEKEGKFFAHTFTMNPASRERYHEEVKSFITRVTQLSDEDPGDSVLQLNIQLFPYEKTLN